VPAVKIVYETLVSEPCPRRTRPPVNNAPFAKNCRSFGREGRNEVREKRKYPEAKEQISPAGMTANPSRNARAQINKSENGRDPTESLNYDFWRPLVRNSPKVGGAPS